MSPSYQGYYTKLLIFIIKLLAEKFGHYYSLETANENKYPKFFEWTNMVIKFGVSV